MGRKFSIVARVVFTTLCSSILFAKLSDAFANPSIATRTFKLESNITGRNNAYSSRTATTTLQAGLFGKLFGNEPPADPNAPKRLFEIPCKSVKVGGLRFTLGLLLIGQQGIPVKGSWKANQANDGVLDMYFNDNTAMFSITLNEESISVDRFGPKLSLQYMLQESIQLHGVLNELHTLAFEGEVVEEENRLLVLQEPGDAIEKARKKLPARKA